VAQYCHCLGHGIGVGLDHGLGIGHGLGVGLGHGLGIGHGMGHGWNELCIHIIGGREDRGTC
jgi:hypothetical protein